MEKHFLASANSCNGFLNFFDNINSNKNGFTYILKGGPGTGKSTIMKTIANSYKNRGSDKWVMLEPGTGLYFTLVDERPFFSTIIPAIIDFGDYRIMEKEKDGQDLSSLLIQKLPIEDGELVFEPEEMEEVHRGAVNMLSNNKYTDVLTTAAEVKLENMESNRSVVTNNLEKIEKSIYSEAGVSKQLFAAEGNVALEKSLTNDMTLMMILMEKIANWVEYLVMSKFSDNNISFRVAAMPISHYNETAFRKDTLSLAQSGYSFLVPMMTLDLDQNDLIDLKNLEINALKLNQIMIPLASSFTTSSGDPNQKVPDEKGGKITGPNKDPNEVNKKPDGEKSDKTIRNLESQS